MMTDRIKLTEEDMWVGIDVSPQFIHLAIRPALEFYKANIDEKKVIELKSQILEDQKIVDGVCALWKSCQVMIDSYQEQIDNIETNGLNESFLEIQLEKELFVRRHMEDMVLFKTGKDIKEILKDDK